MPGGLLATFAIVFVATNVLSAANGDFRTLPLLEAVPLWLAFSAFMVVGALVVAHRPGNPIGWVFSASPPSAASSAMAETYGRYAYETRPGSLPGAIVATWFAWSSWYPTVALAVVFTPLLFPTGRLPSPRWRPVAWLAGAATAAIVALAVLQPTFVLESGRTVDRNLLAYRDDNHLSTPTRPGCRRCSPTSSTGPSQAAIEHPLAHPRGPAGSVNTSAAGIPHRGRALSLGPRSAERAAADPSSQGRCQPLVAVGLRTTLSGRPGVRRSRTHGGCGRRTRRR